MRIPFNSLNSLQSIDTAFQLFSPSNRASQFSKDLYGAYHYIMTHGNEADRNRVLKRLSRRPLPNIALQTVDGNWLTFGQIKGRNHEVFDVLYNYFQGSGPRTIEDIHYALRPVGVIGFEGSVKSFSGTYKRIDLKDKCLPESLLNY